MLSGLGPVHTEQHTSGPVGTPHSSSPLHILFSFQMSTVNSDVSGGADGRNAESSRGAVDSPKVAPGTELPQASTPGVASFPFPQGKAPFHPTYANSFGVPLRSVKKQPQVSGKQRVSSTASVCSKSSQKSCKSTASQIQEVAGDDCCAHCALACLFCELVSLCSLALDCVGCGGCLKVCSGADGGESLTGSCCCGEAGGGHCPCGFGCGMLQDCCGSSDCLEICLECCSICFPS